MSGLTFYAVTLPSIPTVSREWLSQHRSELEDGTPPFPALLPHDRFVRRAQAVKKQYRDILAHPLFFEIGSIYYGEGAPQWKMVVEKWKKLQAGEKLEETEEPILDFRSDSHVFHNGGASIGNVS